MKPRYFVQETRGYSRSTHVKPAISYSVLDRYWCYREVSKYYAQSAGGPYRRERAYAECERLNALDREWHREQAA